MTEEDFKETRNCRETSNEQRLVQEVTDNRWAISDQGGLKGTLINVDMVTMDGTWNNGTDPSYSVWICVV